MFTLLLFNLKNYHSTYCAHLFNSAYLLRAIYNYITIGTFIFPQLLSQTIT